MYVVEFEDFEIEFLKAKTGYDNDEEALEHFVFLVHDMGMTHYQIRPCLKRLMQMDSKNVDSE